MLQHTGKKHLNWELTLIYANFTSFTRNCGTMNYITTTLKNVQLPIYVLLAALPWMIKSIKLTTHHTRCQLHHMINWYVVNKILGLSQITPRLRLKPSIVKVTTNTNPRICLYDSQKPQNALEQPNLGRTNILTFQSEGTHLAISCYEQFILKKTG